MMSTKKIIISLFFIFAILSFVSALEVKKTEIIIVTDPYQNMSVVVQDNGGSTLQTFSGRARKFGEYRIKYYGVVDKIKVAVSIIKDNETQEVLVSKDFGPYNVGAQVNVTLKYLSQDASEENEVIPIPSNLLNITSNSTSNVTINASSVASIPLTGRAVGGSIQGAIGKLSPTYYYVIIGVVGLGIFVFVMRRRLSVKRESVPKEPDHQKMFNKKEEKVIVKEEFTPPIDSIVVSPDKSNVQELQQKIGDLQKQLEQVRGEEKLIRLQRQLSREQQELKKLNNPSEPRRDVSQNNSSPNMNSLDESKK